MAAKIGMSNANKSLKGQKSGIKSKMGFVVMAALVLHSVDLALSFWEGGDASATWHFMTPLAVLLACFVCVHHAIVSRSNEQDFVKPKATRSRDVEPSKDESSKSRYGKWNAEIDESARNGDLESAERAVKRMQAAGVEPNTSVYSSLIHACAKSGNVMRADAWLEK